MNKAHCGVRFFPRFSVRTMLVLFLGISIVASWFGANWRKAKQQRTAIREIHSLGGITISNFAIGDTIRPHYPSLRSRIFGNELSDDVFMIDLNSTDISANRIQKMIPWIKELRTPEPNLLTGPEGYIMLKLWANPNLNDTILTNLKQELPNTRLNLIDPFVSHELDR